MPANFCLPAEKSPCVVMSHGLESSKEGDKWLVLAPRLCDSGFAALRFSSWAARRKSVTSAGVGSQPYSTKAAPTGMIWR